MTNEGGVPNLHRPRTSERPHLTHTQYTPNTFTVFRLQQALCGSKGQKRLHFCAHTHHTARPPGSPAAHGSLTRLTAELSHRPHTLYTPVHPVCLRLRPRAVGPAQTSFTGWPELKIVTKIVKECLCCKCK